MFGPITIPFEAKVLFNTLKHERSHADALFHAKFSALAEMCAGSKELGYEMLWQGNAE